MWQYTAKRVDCSLSCRTLCSASSLQAPSDQKILLPHAGSGSASHHEMETLAKFEIMDGAPVRGENIPIRLVWY